MPCLQLTYPAGQPGQRKYSAIRVGPEEAVEVGLGDGFERSEVLDPGVADQQIQAAELGYHRADQFVGLRHVTDIGRESRRGTPVVAEVVDERMTHIVAPRTTCMTAVRRSSSCATDGTWRTTPTSSR